MVTNSNFPKQEQKRKIKPMLNRSCKCVGCSNPKSCSQTTKPRRAWCRFCLCGANSKGKPCVWTLCRNSAATERLVRKELLRQKGIVDALREHNSTRPVVVIEDDDGPVGVSERPRGMGNSDKKEVDRDVECAICLCPLTDPTSPIGCTHTFCMVCITQWNEFNPVCPLCKRGIQHLAQIVN